MRDIAHMQDPEAYNRFERGIDRLVYGRPEDSEFFPSAPRITEDQRFRMKQMQDGGASFFQAFKAVVIGGTE